MDLGSTLLPVLVVMMCLLGAKRCPNGDKINCPCPPIPPRILTELPPLTCFQINSSFRYKCVRGHLRKAGTSNLTRCKEVNGTAQWTSPSLECIPDTRITTTQPPEIRTDNRHDPIVPTTVTASTSPQMSQHRSISASVTAETDSAEPTSPGQQVLSDHSQEVENLRTTKAMDWITSTSTTTEPSDNRTVNPRVANSTKLSSTTTTLIALASLVTVCALIGISFLCYKRRSKRISKHTAEEQMPMNHVPPASAS